jgi:hypothetical protein
MVLIAVIHWGSSAWVVICLILRLEPAGSLRGALDVKPQRGELGRLQQAEDDFFGLDAPLEHR